MLAAFRAFAKSWVARILLGLLVIAFGIWGVNDAFKAKFSTDVVTAGRAKVTQQEFKRLWSNALKQVSEQQNGGQAIPPVDAVKAGLLDQLLQQVADGEALSELIRRVGIRPSDALIAKEVGAIPAFTNPVTGKFDPNLYAQTLGQNELTVDTFEKGLRNEIADGQFSAGVGVGLRPPAIYTALAGVYGFSNHGAAMIVVSPKSVEAPPKPTDAQLRAFMQQNAERLRRPETRSISLLRFSTAALTPTMPVDEAQVKARFDAAKGQLTTPERRSFVALQVTSAQMAQMVGARLTRGEDPAVVAKATGRPPLVYNDAEQGAVSDQAIAQAAFALQPGQVSNPVQGQLGGVAIVKVTKVTPGKPATLAEARPQLENLVKEKAAQEKVYAQVQKYDETNSSGAPLAKAAEAAGVKVYQLGPMTKEGQGLDGQPVRGLNAQMLKDVFATGQGAETEVVDLGKGEYYALRVDKISPAALPSLDEVRPGLTALYMQRQLIERMQAKAEAISARLNKGETVEAVAASTGLQVSRVQGLSRANARQYAQLGEGFLNRLFTAKAGEVFTAPIGQAGFAVAKADRPAAPDPRMVAAIGQAQKAQLQMSMFREVGDMIRTAARERIKPRISKERALQAIGVSAEDAAAAQPEKAS